MDQTKLKEAVENILMKSNTGVMATVKGKHPHARYMTFTNNNLTLYTPTSKNTDKAEEIAENPNTHILLGYDGEGFGDAYVEYQGKVAINEDAALKNELWSEEMKIWFEGPEDPDLIILEIKPIEIQLMNKKGTSPQTLEL